MRTRLGAPPQPPRTVPASGRLWTWVLVAALAFLALAAPARAAPPGPRPLRAVDVPCTGCRLVLPAAGAPSTSTVPLLVVLHGDWGHGADELLAAWERHALKKGIGVLALSCPKDKGCKGSWWRWDGDPAWVTAQVDAVAAKHPIDRDRVWLAGWSGGASYMGHHAGAFKRSFAALVYHGGGNAPFDSGCEPGRAAPVFFLEGTGNPLHGLAVRLKEHHEACHDDVVWKALPHADHDAEWTALAAHGEAIVGWLLGRPSLTRPSLRR